MKKVGELMQESIEAMENGATDAAFASVCAAVTETLKKSLAAEDLNGTDYQNFVKANWRLLCFMGLPNALPMPLDVEFNLTKIFHGFTLRNVEEMILHLIRQTALMGRVPPQFRFHAGNRFIVGGNQILIPNALVGGLVGIVIFQPANLGEIVPDNYWLNISDFKMFVSELWGRIDLAERVMRFYLD